MSAKIYGTIVGTTLPKPNWKQDDPRKGDYIKNRPKVVLYTEQKLTDEQKAQARRNIGACTGINGMVEVTHDGKGNVTMTTTATVSDDGNGNVTIG